MFLNCASYFTERLENEGRKQGHLNYILKIMLTTWVSHPYQQLTALTIGKWKLALLGSCSVTDAMKEREE